jgi:hypothetical protein
MATLTTQHQRCGRCHFTRGDRQAEGERLPNEIYRPEGASSVAWIKSLKVSQSRGLNDSCPLARVTFRLSWSSCHPSVSPLNARKPGSIRESASSLRSSHHLSMSDWAVLIQIVALQPASLNTAHL